MEKEKDLLKAIRDALKYCMEHDILKEYLEKYETEVTNMLYYEYNQELEREVIQEEAMEKGIEIGEKKGIEEERNFVISLIDQGLSLEEIKQRLTQTTTS